MARGGPAAADLMAGHIDMMFDTTACAVPRIKSGQLRALDNAARQVLAQEHVKKKLADLGMTPYYASGPELGRQIAQETVDWADVIKKAGVTFE